MERYVMRRKTDGKFFVVRRSGRGFGPLMTKDPNEASIYNHPNPMGFRHMKDDWEAIPVDVKVELQSP